MPTERRSKVSCWAVGGIDSSMARSPTTTRPLVAGPSMLMQRRRVLLPDPLGPMTATTSPDPSVRHTSSSTTCLPYCLQIASSRKIGLADWPATAFGGNLRVSGLKFIIGTGYPSDILFDWRVCKKFRSVNIVVVESCRVETEGHDADQPTRRALKRRSPGFRSVHIYGGGRENQR